MGKSVLSLNILVQDANGLNSTNFFRGFMVGGNHTTTYILTLYWHIIEIYDGRIYRFTIRFRLLSKAFTQNELTKKSFPEITAFAWKWQKF